MPGLELTNFVLLACDFQILGEPAEQEVRLPRIDALGAAPESESADAEGEPPEEGKPREGRVVEGEDIPALTYRGEIELASVSLRFEVQREVEPDEYVLLLHAWLTDKSAPFMLDVVTGSRFSVPDEDEPSLAQVAMTLVFMTYPYLRETISAITVRSPYQGMVLPPLSRLPHPRVEASGSSTE